MGHIRLSIRPTRVKNDSSWGRKLEKFRKFFFDIVMYSFELEFQKFNRL